MSARYNVINGSSIYFYAINSTTLFVRAENDSIVFRAEGDVNWSEMMSYELGFFNSVNATNLTNEEITLISESGCCGVYSDGTFSVYRDVCGETFSVPEIDTGMTWLAVFIPLLPAIAAALFVMKTDSKKYLVFLLGGVGWLIALLCREPLLQLIASSDLITAIIVSSILAGLFEEIGRYLIMKYVPVCRQNPIAFGTGWGVGEAVIIFSLNLAVLLMLNQAILFSDVIPGAVERLLAVLLHVGLTMIVFKSFDKISFLPAAIVLHSAVNLISSLLYYVLFADVWIVECVIALFVIGTAAIAYFANKGTK
jgi:uncharacterized membrane protein YhfC